ncbi:MAG: hypothetical protein PVJ17_12710 [Lysobacterales bacterium]|jgi:catalase (peroxidase I)
MRGGANGARIRLAPQKDWIGMILATAVKMAIAFLMIGIFLFQLGWGGLAAG